MSSTLIIFEKVAWMPKALCFEKALDQMAAELDTQEHGLREYLLVREEEYFLDLRTLDQSEISKIAFALSHILEANLQQIEHDERARWYCKMLITLKAIITYYRLSPIKDEEEMVLTISEDVAWIAPRQFYILALEELALFAGSRWLREYLLTARHKTDKANLTYFTNQQFCEFADATQQFFDRYGMDMMPGTSAIGMGEDFGPYGVQLYELVQQDVRYRECIK